MATAEPCWSVTGRLLQLFHDLVDGEALRPLPRGVFLEGGDEFRDDRLSRDHHEPMAQRPIPIGIRRDICAFVRVHPQIVEQRKPPNGERLAPYVQCAGRLLLGEYELPVSKAQCDELAVIVEID